MSDRRGEPVRRNDTPKVSLGKLIDRQSSQPSRSKTLLLPAEKAALCRNLSLALVHLASDFWVHDKWSLDNIFLASNPNGDHGPTLDREGPYLSSFLSDCQPENSIPSRSEPTTSPFKSRMLSFAQILMEIYLEERLCQNIPEDGKRYALIRDRLKEPIVKRSVPAVVIAAVEACIEVFRSEDWDEEPSKDWIFNQIIKKLDENFRLWGLPQRSEPRNWEEKTLMAIREKRQSLEMPTEFSRVRFEIPTPIDDKRPKRLVFMSHVTFFGTLTVLDSSHQRCQVTSGEAWSTI